MNVFWEKNFNSYSYRLELIFIEEFSIFFIVWIDIYMVKELDNSFWFLSFNVVIWSFYIDFGRILNWEVLKNRIDYCIVFVCINCIFDNIFVRIYFDLMI